MKINFSLKQLSLKKAWAWIVGAARQLWMIISRNFWMKVLSLLLAILLWNYVVSSNTAITRTKTVSNIEGYITNQTTLSSYKLALLDDPSDLLDDVTVRIEVPQADYARVAADNVKVTLDLAGVRTAGTQQVALKATTAYGHVTGILPETLTLTFETLDSRSIPVSARVSGDASDDYWYNCARTNPSAITVSGAASVVRSITQARVDSDVTGAQGSYTRAEPYLLLDGDGNEIPQTMLNCSSSSITVAMDVYPMKELPVSAEIGNVVAGQPAEGYKVTSVSIQPETVAVAAEAELLSGISELRIVPVSVEGLSQNISARAEISLLSDFKNVSAEQVYVNIEISPDDD